MMFAFLKYFYIIWVLLTTYQQLRSQYIRVENPLHKQSEIACMLCFLAKRVSMLEPATSWYVITVKSRLLAHISKTLLFLQTSVGSRQSSFKPGTKVYTLKYALVNAHLLIDHLCTLVILPKVSRRKK